jgi:FkbM family methyltransferase
VSVRLTNWLLSVFPRKMGEGFERKRWFVEAGAHNGLYDPVAGGSCTLALEQAGWDGLCIEPSTYFANLAANRRCKVSCTALGEKDDQVKMFRQILGDRVELSGLLDHFQPDRRAKLRSGDMPYRDRRVVTLTLTTALAEHDAPATIEFLCLDTEGSELAILRGHDFNRYRFLTAFVEYNGVGSRREELQSFMASRGYERTLDDGINLLFLDKSYPFPGEDPP